MGSRATKAAMWVCVVHTLACNSASAPEIAGDGGAGMFDTGHQVRADAAADAFTTIDVPLIPTTDTGPSSGEATDIACSDFRDDDHNGLTDCGDPACGPTHVCCVGSTSARCCSPPSTLVPMIALDACTTTLDACVSGVDSFGAPLPALSSMRADGGACVLGGAMAPGGADRCDGGLVSQRVIDLGVNSVAIEARVGVSASAASSLDAIAIGLSAQDDLTTVTLPRVQPILSVIVSATDQRIRVVVGDLELPAHALAPILGSAPGCSELDVRIVTSPAGTFDASVRVPSSSSWTTIETARPFDRSTSARVVAYGRSTSTDGSAHAWLRNVSTAVGLCDVYAPARDDKGAFEPVPSTGQSIRSVSRADTLAVYELDGTIYAAGVNATGHLFALGRQDGDRVLVPGEAAFMQSGLADPELVSITGALRLFFTGIDASGVRSIGYLDFDPTLTTRVSGSTPRQLIAPNDVAAAHVDGPAYLETNDGMTRRWIVFRAVVSDTRSELRAAELVGSNAVLGIVAETRDAAATASQFYTPLHPSSPADALYVNRASDDTAFDHDEIASPEVVSYHGVLRVFFAGRLGARWSIGMLRSPDFVHFERAYDAPVLGPSGVGFDAVSVMDPAAWLDSTGELALYYTGSDGSTMEPGLATQQVPLP